MLYEQALKANLQERFKASAPQPSFPTYTDRTRWEALPASVKKPWLDLAIAHLHYNWPALRMEYYLNIKRRGETFTGWLAFCERRSLLGVFLIAECMEGKRRFFDQIVNGIYAICEETSWIQMMSIRDNDFALPDENDNFVDLCSVETSQLFAWILLLMGSELDSECPRIRKRMNEEVLRRVVRPYLDRSDYWWMGFEDTRINNWNPWCNGHMISTVAFMDFAPEIKAAVLEKVCRSLDIYLERYAGDGACDEGPSYWSAAGMGLGKCVDLLHHVTEGAIDGSSIEKLKLIGSYYYKVHIHDHWFVNYADGDAKLEIGSGVYRFGKLLNDKALTNLGRFAKSPTPVLNHWFSIYDYLAGIFDADERSALPAEAPYIEKAYFNICEILVARERAGSADGFFLSAKGGNNVESHNHNDVGNFVVFLDGKPLFIDLGTEEYSLKTFSKERFSIWYLQSQYHNCPTIAGNMQHDGREYYAAGTRYETGEGFDRLVMDLTHAYPSETSVGRWERSISLHRDVKPYILIRDSYRGIAQAGTAYNFVTCARPTKEPGRIVLDCGGGTRAELDYDENALDATIEEIPITESRLHRNWGDTVWRIVLLEKEIVREATRNFVIQRA